MARGESDHTGAKVHDLFAAIERVRTAQAERDDGIAELTQAARARLELLAQDLRPVFDDVPEHHDHFEFALAGGETPRLWIDMTAHVRMGRDGRTYEFVKDTRLGRTILADSANRDEIAGRVTDYVAERILERERAMEGARTAMRPRAAGWRRAGRPAAAPFAPPGAVRDSRLAWLVALWFLLGLIAGATIMLVWTWQGPVPAF